MHEQAQEAIAALKQLAATHNDSRILEQATTLEKIIQKYEFAAKRLLREKPSEKDI